MTCPVWRSTLRTPEYGASAFRRTTNSAALQRVAGEGLSGRDSCKRTHSARQFQQLSATGAIQTQSLPIRMT